MKTIIRNANDTFSILNAASGCAYGSFDSRDEAAEAMAQAAMADQLSRCGE